ncbi:MAG: PSD1 and planctomycete cytochrome C domain-containing protein [Prosthecobacter sp.]|nr:PSD1 and planctomycete cytochrome C domain-containing protein [Prosthecobacter sp.]
MRRLRSWLLFAVLSAAVTGRGAVDFAKEVHPVLQRACFECHGAEQAKSGLRLHTQETFRAGGKNGPVVTPNDPAHSELLRRISLPRSDKEAMPKRGTPLTQAEIALIREWVAAGAVWPASIQNARHWSYVPPQRPALPAVKDQAWPANEIDHFVLARLEKQGWRPSREADPSVLYRRLSLDLTGLPPLVADVEKFAKAYAADARKAVEAAADRLLASKEFGVRWARPWLDVARYADSHGFQRDDLREIWGYRDWVVDALNADTPFDQFTIEQVAGDLLPAAKPSQIIATGFHRCTPTNVEAGTEPEESRINQVIDRVNTTGAVWLGTTLECAQCHNHKYDPISQRDYYSLLAYFNNTENETARTNPTVPGSIKFNGVPFAMPANSREAELAKLETQMKDVDARIAAHQKPPSKTPALASNTTKGQLHALRPTTLNSDASAEYEIQPDHSVLFSGAAPDGDTCTLEADLPAGQITGVLIEALTDPSIPGDGPGRGDAARPNFVLQQVEAAFLPGGAKEPAQRLKFAQAFASFSQKNLQVEGLLEDDPKTGWAIGPLFSKPHWAALALDKPLQVEPGAKLSLKLVQHFGGGRVIGRLRVSAILGEVESCLPEPYADEARPSKKGRRAKPADPALAALEREKSVLQRQIDANKPTTTEVMKEMEQPRMTAIFKRGAYTDPTDPVTAGTPAIFDAKAKGPPNRLTLAQWLVSRDNPLTARVTVNRWWHELFGRGLVATAEDFGIKGTSPTHPELLDWLAVEFMDRDWSMKALLKKIVTSATYRQSSSVYEGLSVAQGGIHPAASLDPDNTLLWHGARQRMDAEMIRDNALSISGLLNLKQGGPPIRPPQPDGLWTKVGGQNYKYEVSTGGEQHRRGLYVVLKRGAPYPSFASFDASARMACVVRRSRSNTPLQALTLLNDPVYVEATKAFARRIVAESPSSDINVMLGHALRIALAREARPAELQVLRSLFASQKKTATEAAAWYAVAAALLNLDETITKG